MAVVACCHTICTRVRTTSMEQDHVWTQATRTLMGPLPPPHTGSLLPNTRPLFPHIEKVPPHRATPQLMGPLPIHETTPPTHRITPSTRCHSPHTPPHPCAQTVVTCCRHSVQGFCHTAPLLHLAYLVCCALPKLNWHCVLAVGRSLLPGCYLPAT